MNQLDDFERVLKQTEQAYLLLEPVRPERARFRFTGRFAGREVIWNAELTPMEPGEHKQSIEVGEPSGKEIPVKIRLALRQITRPDILKTILMIRNYKNLRTGRHEWSAP